AERYDISARVAGRATGPELDLMLRELLKDRFMLTFHHEMKNLSVYALTARNKSNKLHPHALNGIPSVTPTTTGLAFRNMPMGDFAPGYLSSSAAVDRPVVDKTGLEGVFDFDLPLSPDLMRRAVRAGDDPL